MKRQIALAVGVVSLAGMLSLGQAAQAQVLPNFLGLPVPGGIGTAQQVMTANNIQQRIANDGAQINASASAGQINGYTASNLQVALSNVANQLNADLSYGALSFDQANSLLSQLSSIESQLATSAASFNNGYYGAVPAYNTVPVYNAAPYYGGNPNRGWRNNELKDWEKNRQKMLNVSRNEMIQQQGALNRQADFMRHQQEQNAHAAAQQQQQAFRMQQQAAHMQQQAFRAQQQAFQPHQQSFQPHDVKPQGNFDKHHH